MKILKSLLVGVCGVYCFIHRDSGMCYVGSGVNIWKRYMEHLRSVGTSRSTLIHRALAAFSIDAFDFEVLEQCDPSALLGRETFYIALMDSAGPNGFNVVKKPGAGHYGTKLSESTRARMSVSSLAQNSRPENKARKSEILKERWEDAEYRESQIKRIRETRADDAVREKTGALSRKMWAKPGHREKFISAVSKPLTVAYPGGRVDNYPSLKAALAGTGECRVVVWNCMKSGKATPSGLVFTYTPKAKHPGDR